MSTTDFFLGRLFLRIFPLILIISCSKVVDQIPERSTATFFIDKIEGESVISKVDSTYLIPQSRLYNFKACTKDIVQSKPILGQKFEILRDNNSQTALSDEQGCLNWSETFNYNFVSQGNFIKIKRTIVAKNLHKGSVDIEAIVNPWAHGTDTTTVIDPSKQTVNALMNEVPGVSSLVSDKVKIPLWAIAPRLAILQNGFTNSGTSMLLQFQTKLSLILKDSANQNVQYQLNSGLFDVELILYNSIEENGKIMHLPITQGFITNLSLTQDTLIAELPFTLEHLPSNRGKILLGIKILAPNNNLGLDSFESIFLVSDNSSINVDKSITPVTGLTFQFEKAELNKPPKQRKIAIDSVLPGLEVEKLDIKFFKIGHESTNKRQVFYNIKTCIKNNVSKQIIRDELFSVILASKSEMKLKTNQDGCISWDDSITHSVFENEHYINSSIVIKNADYKFSKTIEIQINPWSNGGNFGRDNRFVDDLGSLTINPSHENAKVVFDNYNFSVLNYNYEINKNLDLNLIKHGILALSARVTRHSSFTDGRMANEGLRDGKYLLKWAVVSLNDSQKIDTVLSMNQKEINSQAGTIKTDIDFKINSFEKLNHRSRLIIALYTIKEQKGVTVIDRNSNLEATPYVSSIVLNNDQDNQKLIPLEESRILDNGKKDVFDYLENFSSIVNMSKNQEIMRKDSTNRLLGTQNLVKIDLSKESLFNSGKSTLDNTSLLSFAKSGKLTTELSEKFCSFWFKDYLRRIKPDSKNSIFSTSTSLSLIIQNCVNKSKDDQTSFFAIEKKLLVKNIGKIKYKKGLTSNITVGNSFSVTKSEAKSQSKAWAWSTTGGLSLEFLGVIKAGTSGSYTVAKTETNSDYLNNSVQISNNTSLLLQSSFFNIELTAYEECSAIRLNPSLFKSSSDYLKIWNPNLKNEDILKLSTAGFFICTGVTNKNPIQKEEAYYLITQDNSYNHGEQDAFNPDNQTLFMTLRGKNDLNALLKLIQGSLSTPTSSINMEPSSNLSNDLLFKLPSWSGIYSE
jgi:hypothetical protein